MNLATEFLIRILQLRKETVTVNKNLVDITALVENIGEEYSGKEVVQVYVSSPGKRLKREFQSLVAFEKTKDLKLGQMQAITLSFDLTDIAAYDEEQASWILEPGRYIIRMGNSLRNTKRVAALTLDECITVETAVSICKIQAPIKEIEPPELQLTEKGQDIFKFTISSRDFTCKANQYENLPITTDKKINSILDSLNHKELVELVVGAGQSGKCCNLTPGAVGRTTSALWKRGIPNINMTDGPAGINVHQKIIITSRGKEKYTDIPKFFNYGFLGKVKFLSKANEKQGTIHYQYCTAWPVEILQAQTWNLSLMKKVGKAISRELDEIGATLWLALGMNIHRNPLCGRNFEYYSEGPYLTGKLAVALTKGVQSISGIGTTIKHFACNNQEDNRMKVSSNVKERALRVTHGVAAMNNSFVDCIEKK